MCAESKKLFTKKKCQKYLCKSLKNTELLNKLSLFNSYICLPVLWHAKKVLHIKFNSCTSKMRGNWYEFLQNIRITLKFLIGTSIFSSLSAYKYTSFFLFLCSCNYAVKLILLKLQGNWYEFVAKYQCKI